MNQCLALCKSAAVKTVKLVTAAINHLILRLPAHFCSGVLYNGSCGFIVSDATGVNPPVRKSGEKVQRHKGCVRGSKIPC